MNIFLSLPAVEQLAAAPLPVQKSFIKQIKFLARDLKHSSLHAKKYEESRDLWQARVNDDCCFFFKIREDTYQIEDIVPHPK